MFKMTAAPVEVRAVSEELLQPEGSIPTIHHTKPKNPNQAKAAKGGKFVVSLRARCSVGAGPVGGSVSAGV